jgi:hypothetical protein
MTNEQRIMAEYHELLRGVKAGTIEADDLYHCATCWAWITNSTLHRHVRLDVDERADEINVEADLADAQEVK